MSLFPIDNYLTGSESNVGWSLKRSQNDQGFPQWRGGGD